MRRGLALIVGAASVWAASVATAGPNEPAGSTVLTEWALNGAMPSGWDADGPLNIVSDASAPQTPPTAQQHTFPIGFSSGGISPRNIFYNIPNGGTRRLYTDTWIKISNPWQQHQAQTSKLTFFNFSPGSWAMVLGAFGASPPFQLDIYFPVNTASFGPTANNCHLSPRGQADCPGTVNAILPNVGSGQIALGEWFRAETCTEMSTTPAGFNGIIRVWLNGSLVISHNNVNFPLEPIFLYEMDPTWGGNGGPNKTQTDYIRYDHVRLSVPPAGGCASGGGGTSPPPPPPPLPPNAPTNLFLTGLHWLTDLVGWPRWMDGGAL